MKKKSMKKKVYVVLRGWVFSEYVTDFDTMEKAVEYIENIKDKLERDLYCIDTKYVERG